MTLSFHSQVPALRRWAANSQTVRPDGEFVVYWMTSQRRPTFNFALQRALEWAHELNRPLLILEALRSAYPWACRRFHRFVMQGMEDHRDYFAGCAVTYYPYLEPRPGAGSGLLEALARRACVVVGDHFPCFFLPRMQAAAAARLPVLLELVDGNGLLPLRASERAYARALDFRRFLQKELAPHLHATPQIHPLRQARLPRLQDPLPEFQRWAPASAELLAGSLEGFPISAAVPEVAERGGFRSADRVLTRFWNERLDQYADRRSQPSLEVASGLSAYLHFGHISVHQVWRELADLEDWSPDKLPRRAHGSKEGSWGMSGNAEAFLDEIVTWRELGYNMCQHRPDYDQYASLPEWARQSLDEHRRDPRPHLYSRDELEWGKTTDPLWNAAQRQLREEGRIHNYLRMLWGKKVLEWSESPEQALEILIELNNKYALDGRNPNSYSGIFWCLGRYDRPWFERPVFGVVRFMSSQATARKFKLEGYLRKWGEVAS